MTWPPPVPGNRPSDGPTATPWSPHQTGPQGATGPAAFDDPPTAPRPAPPVPAGPPPGRHRKRLLVALAVLVVGAAAVGGGLVLASGTDTTPAVGLGTTSTASRTSVAPSPTAPVRVTATATATVTVSTTPVAPATVPAAVGQTYSLPGVMRLRGPAGWTADTSAGIPRVIDYLAPGSTARFQGATFRFGIGNINPAADIATEAQVSAQFLRATYDAQIVAITFTPYLGSTAADVEYTHVSKDFGVARHGIERLWFGAGVTYIVQSSDVATQWAQASAVFAQLTASVVVG